MAGISEDGTRFPGRFIFRWNDETDGLLLRGGEGIPGKCDVVTESIGVMLPEKISLGSATVGDCSGDCMLTVLVFAEASIIKGGSKGVDAKFSSISTVVGHRFALSISIGMGGLRYVKSSREPKTLLVGVGGIWKGSYERSNGRRVEFETDDERLEAARETEYSGCESAVNTGLGFLKRNLRENDGNLVPNRVARPAIGDSIALLFFERGLNEVISPSLKNPSTRS